MSGSCMSWVSESTAWTLTNMLVHYQRQNIALAGTLVFVAIRGSSVQKERQTVNSHRGVTKLTADALFLCGSWAFPVLSRVRCRVPKDEDLFYFNMAPGVHNVSRRSFCLCNGSNICDRRAVSDTTADSSDPRHNVRLKVPDSPISPAKRRRRREAFDQTQDESAGHSRTYRAPYEYVLHLRVTSKRHLYHTSLPHNITSAPTLPVFCTIAPA